MQADRLLDSASPFYVGFALQIPQPSQTFWSAGKISLGKRNAEKGNPNSGER